MDYSGRGNLQREVVAQRHECIYSLANQNGKVTRFIIRRGHHKIDLTLVLRFLDQLDRF